MNSTYAVMDKLSLITKARTLKILAEKLGMEYSTLRNRCSRDSLPFKEVLQYCYDNDIDIATLLFE